MTDNIHPPFEIPQPLATDLETKLGKLLNVGSEAVELGKSILVSHLAGKSPDSDYKLVSYLIFAKGSRLFRPFSASAELDVASMAYRSAVRSSKT